MANKPGSKLSCGFVEVAAAGTSQPLAAAGQGITAQQVLVQALKSNEGDIVIGGPEVEFDEGAHGSTERAGVYLAKGSSTILTLDIGDPARIFVDVEKAKDGASWVAVLS